MPMCVKCQSYIRAPVFSKNHAVFFFAAVIKVPALNKKQLQLTIIGCLHHVNEATGMNDMVNGI